MTKELIFPRMVPASLAALLLGSLPLVGWSSEGGFEEANIFFELNNTDGDLGIHALIDGDAWDKLVIRDPDKRKILDIQVKGRARDQGLTEIFFESAEPPFESDDPEEVTLLPEEFFDRFPEGDYGIRGTTLEGDVLENRVLITHVMPAPPDNIQVNGIPAAEDCDADLPVVWDGEDVTISWGEVTTSHPELGTQGVLIDVVNYELVAEIDETPYRTSVILPPSVTSFQLPSEILALNNKVKFEVLVRESSYNQTAVESCFCIDECPVEEEE